MNTRYQGSVVISSVILTLVVTILISLGMWQLSRMTEKQAYLADIATKMSQPALSLQEAYQNKVANQNTPVTISGRLPAKHIWYLDNQPFNGDIGYHVYTPLETSVGTVLANLGWVKAPITRQEWPDVIVPSQLYKEAGVITKPSHNPFVDDTIIETLYRGDQTQYRVQGINLEQAEAQLGNPLLSFTLTLTETSPDFARQWRPVVMPPEKHIGYAIQWFGLAIAAFIIGVIAILKTRKKHGEI